MVKLTFGSFFIVSEVNLLALLLLKSYIIIDPVPVSEIYAILVSSSTVMSFKKLALYGAVLLSNSNLLISLSFSISQTIILGVPLIIKL